MEERSHVGVLENGVPAPVDERGEAVGHGVRVAADNVDGPASQRRVDVVAAAGAEQGQHAAPDGVGPQLNGVGIKHAPAATDGIAEAVMRRARAGGGPLPREAPTHRSKVTW